MDDIRYRINEPPVMSEIIDEQVVILNLGTGTYYSVSGTGAAIWQCLATGASVREILSQVRARYTVDGIDAEAALASFVRDLLADALLVARDAAPSEPPAPLAPDTDGAPFTAPVLDRYTDLQQLILFDPVHDVDAESGWPKAKKPDDGAGA